MSEIKLNLLDSDGSIIATVHGSVGDALVAALSAEPESIEELEAALNSFHKCESIPASFVKKYEGREIDDRPYDAGILVTDLAARIIYCESTYSLPAAKGTVKYHDGVQGTATSLDYELASDWIFVYSIEEYRIFSVARTHQPASTNEISRFL